MAILVKICGLTNLEDTMDALELGADFLGFNFYPDSPRYVEPALVGEILEEVPDNILKVGVFVNADRQYVIDTALDLNLDLLQFHGDESPEYCDAMGRPWLKAFRLKDESDLGAIVRYRSEFLLVDSFVERVFGGTGVVSNWDLAKKAKSHGKLFLSGGLKPENIDLALHAVRPYAVDVASGVEESIGIKDRYKMEEFIQKVKNFEQS